MTSLQERHTYQCEQPATSRSHLNTRGATEKAGAHKRSTRASSVTTIINLSSIMILILSVGVACAALNSLRPQHGPPSDGSFGDASGDVGGSSSADVIAIKEGANLDLNCSNAEQTEDMIISWTCNNKPAGFKSNRIYVTDSGRLRIQSAKVGDSCNYRCEAADGFGTWSVFTRVIVVDRQLMNKLTAGNQRIHENNPSAARDKKKPMKGDSTKLTNKEIILNDSQQHHLTKGKPVAAGRHSDSSSSAQDPMAAGAVSNSTSLSDQLFVQIEPEQVTVQRNQSFNLNCKVNHTSHYKVPQIIWLKEFMGRRPSSLEQALQQNLIYLADGYYHTLNWPRSVSYSKASFCANSALVIRHASFVHAGRYVCLSGYLDRLSVEPLPPSQPASGANDDDGQVDQFEPPSISSSVQYVMAVATVTLEKGSNEEEEEEFYYQLRWKDNSLGAVLSRMFSAEGFIWRLILCLLLLFFAILITCFYKQNRTKSAPTRLNGIQGRRATSAEEVDARKNNQPTNQHVMAANPSLIYSRDEQMKLNDSHLYNLMNRSNIINDLERLTTSQQSSTADDDARAASTDNIYSIEHPTRHPTHPNPTSTRQAYHVYGLPANDGEHVYSEIGELARTVAVANSDRNHSTSSFYKVPNKVPRDY